MNFKEIAKELRQRADAKLKVDRAEWRGEKNMIEMFVDDCKDAKKVSWLIAKGKHAEATSAIQDCDTASREVIYGMLERVNADYVTRHIEPNEF